jgi:hypothetical protein
MNKLRLFTRYYITKVERGVDKKRKREKKEEQCIKECIKTSG